MTTSSSLGRFGAVYRGVILALALVLAVPLGTVSAEARVGGGFSFGSRGTRSFTAPPATMTAPRSAQPFSRSFTPGMSQNSFGSAAPQSRRFGFGTGLAAGLLGAGLFGMLTGGGFFGGLSGLASLFGLLLQVALIGGAIMLALRFFRGRRGAPAFAGGFSAANRTGGSGFGAAARSSEPLNLGPQDFNAFERALVDVQTAYGREDINALSRLATPEMVQRFGQDIEQNRRRGVRNAMDDVHLLQGDLAEAWREGAVDYGTVAIRFDARDTMVDRSSGRVVEGNPERPIEATELWTFRRDRGGPWQLSAIQQAA
ncbi:MAG TPA: TIM44-like domain-containing protein [Lichenihabitans sp.]|nr:TIM44-like domain-containing protein [Lichenihabitans sp.]